MTVRNAGGRVLVRSQVPEYGDGLDHVLVLRRSQLAAVLGAALDGAGDPR